MGGGGGLIFLVCCLILSTQPSWRKKESVDRSTVGDKYTWCIFFRALGSGRPEARQRRQLYPRPLWTVATPPKHSLCARHCSRRFCMLAHLMLIIALGVKCSCYFPFIDEEVEGLRRSVTCLDRAGRMWQRWERPGLLTITMSWKG